MIVCIYELSLRFLNFHHVYGNTPGKFYCLKPAEYPREKRKWKLFTEIVDNSVEQVRNHSFSTQYCYTFVKLAIFYTATISLYFSINYRVPVLVILIRHS